MNCHPPAKFLHRCFSRRAAKRRNRAEKQELRSAPDVKLILQVTAADENHTVELYRRSVRDILSHFISPDLRARQVRQIAAGETQPSGDIA